MTNEEDNFDCDDEPLVRILPEEEHSLPGHNANENSSPAHIQKESPYTNKNTYKKQKSKKTPLPKNYFFARNAIKLKIIIFLLFAGAVLAALKELNAIKGYENVLASVNAGTVSDIFDNADFSSGNRNHSEKIAIAQHNGTMPEKPADRKLKIEQIYSFAENVPKTDKKNPDNNKNTAPAAVRQGLRKAEIVAFGNYPQTSRGTKQPIEWLVLSQTPEGEAILLCRYGLEAAQFHLQNGRVNWENSSVRKWLNSSFLDIAFTDKEREYILDSQVDNRSETVSLSDKEIRYWAALMKTDFSALSGKEWKTPYSPPTKDKIFLLSISEAAKLDNAKIMLRPTEYALASAGGAVKMVMPVCGKSGKCARTEITGTSGWWLRTPGIDKDYAAFAFGNKIFPVGTRADYPGNAIRPAMRVKNIFAKSFTILK